MVKSKNNKDTAALRLIADINEQENVGFRSSKDQPFWMLSIKLVSSDVLILSCIKGQRYHPHSKKKKKKKSHLVTKKKKMYLASQTFTFFGFLIVKAKEKLWEAVKAMKISR